jgi:hypothetical protein
LERVIYRELVEAGDLNRMRAFGGLLDVELDPLAFIEISEAIATNRAVVDEDIGELLDIRADESPTLTPAEPLDCSLDTLLHTASFVEPMWAIDSLIKESLRDHANPIGCFNYRMKGATPTTPSGYHASKFVASATIVKATTI